MGTCGKVTWSFCLQRCSFSVLASRWDPCSSVPLEGRLWAIGELPIQDSSVENPRIRKDFLEEVTGLTQVGSYHRCFL